MGLSSRAVRSMEFKGEQMDIGAQWASMNLKACLDYVRQLFHADEPWPENMCEPEPSADLATMEAGWGAD